MPPVKGFSAADYKVLAFLKNDNGKVIAACESDIKKVVFKSVTSRLGKLMLKISFFIE